MQKMNGPAVRWYLVANRTDAVIYRDKKSKFLVVDELLNPEGNMKEGQLDSDRPGTSVSASTGAYPHTVGTERVKHEESARKFGTRIRKALEQNQNEFDELVLVAEPHFMGVLKNSFSAPLLKRVKHQINHEYLDRTAQLRKKIMIAIDADTGA